MIDPFQTFLKLTDSDLAALAKAFRTGCLGADSPASSIDRILSHSSGAEISHDLRTWAGSGFTPAQIAIVLDGLIDVRRERPRLTEAVELVWTGPKASGMVSRDAGVVLREMFQQARKSILIVGFALYQGRVIFEELANRFLEKPDLHVHLCLNIERKHTDRSLDSKIVRRFADKFRKEQWPADRPLPEVYYDPRSLEMDPKKHASLHAKCVVVDRSVSLVTSANLTEAALKRNIEVGAIIRCERFANQLSEHFDILIRDGILKRI